MMEDQSGVEPENGDWIDAANPPPTLKVLLAEIGRVYTPVMLANARAVMAGDAEVLAEVDGQPWSQQPFPYQAKCLKALRDAYAALAPDARALVDTVLDGTGCEALLAG
jgi:hypothetical protein